MLRSFLSFLAIFALFASLPFLGFQFYEGHTDPGILAYFNCIITSIPDHLPNDGNWKYIGHLFAQLYTSFPTFDWYGFTMILFSSLAAFIFIQNIQLLHKTLPTNAMGNSVRVVLIGCFFLYLENIVLLEFTRMSFSLGFMGFLSIATYPLAKAKNKTNLNFPLLGLLAVVLSGLVRIQPALLSLVVVLPLFIFFWMQSKTTFSQAAKNLILPIAFLSILVSISNVAETQTDKDIVENAGYLINIWDVKPTESDFKLENKIDSLTYEMAKIHFMNDIENINSVFFEKIGVRYTRKQVSSIANLLSNNISIINKFKDQGIGSMKRHSGWSALLLAIFLLAAWTNRSDRPRLIQITLMLGYFLTLYFSIAVFIKMADRIFSPLFLAFCVSMAFMINPKEITTGPLKYSRIYTGFSFLLIGLILLEMSFSINLFQTRKADVSYRNTVLKYANKLDVKYQFVGFVSGWLYSKPFQQEDIINPKTTYLSIDNQAFCYIATYKEKMKNETGHSSAEGYWKFMKANASDCVIISEEGRLNKIVEYVNLQYNLNLKIEPIIVDFKEYLDDAPENAWSAGIFRITG